MLFALVTPRRTGDGLPSFEALFRFRVIGEVETEAMRGLSRTRAVEKVASREHLTLDGTRRTVSARSLYRWLGRYEEAGRDLRARREIGLLGRFH